MVITCPDTSGLIERENQRWISCGAVGFQQRENGVAVISSA
jgi:hypothetical protein